MVVYKVVFPIGGDVDSIINQASRILGMPGYANGIERWTRVKDRKDAVVYEYGNGRSFGIDGNTAKSLQVLCGLQVGFLRR